ncbi:NFACT RNA binding domain-containing protein [Clostridium sp. CCUG 7971]|uniref:Rqc2 family fibronectin-binding protein n=1 Tax=Clostridium sp. CCUG 7971 TaxID=2811414 RepID=UPI001ABBD521|nr:NFACT RNA binding domain-containing protein [Clostridium sp. CCUG 7971]MBO3444171.1 NFACT family protein [Clostridium sp. CCUG 7971]
MALDGLVIHSIVDELSSKILGGKVDKVHQPENDELVLHIRNNKENFKLILSASASNPRVYLAENYKKENPISAPMFCMLFRKYIQNGIVVGVSQIGFERIIKISVESFDELKEKTTKDIYIEIMGRHSNIILTHALDNKVIDSAKRIPFSVSRVRQLLPGVTYVLPPSQDKLNPLDNIPKESFVTTLKSFEGAIFKSVYSKFLGISPIVAKEICFRANIDEKLNTTDCNDSQFDSLYGEFSNLFNNINNNKYNPCIVINEDIDKVIDFSCIDLTLFKELSFINDESMSKILEDYYRTKDIKDRIHQRSSDLRKSISIKLDRLYNKLHKQEEELIESENADIFKVKGELITSYIYMIEKGMKNVEVSNFYDPEYKDITISLNKNLTPSENAQKYFKKYNKMKTAKKELAHQIEISLDEINYLENIILSIENCENLAELLDIREELSRVGYLKIKGKNNKKVNTNKETKLTTKPHEFISSDGFKILVGKNNKQNDHLTLKIADNNDIWMHTKNIPGSHVIIKTEGKEVSDEAIFEGAMLAAYFSKSKMSSQVPVDYTKKKNIKKPNGAKPGMVIYETNSTVYVTPTEELVAKLKIKE